MGESIVVSKREFYRMISHVYLFLFLSLTVTSGGLRTAVQILTLLMYVVHFHWMMKAGKADKAN